MKTSKEIRKEFIDFFKNKRHEFVPSSPLVPKDDPTLLFANAGMNQFKDVFLEKGTRPYKRAVNSQKCLRVSGKHNDLEEVGVDTYHHTFFEMLGNWSFGDYYKKEAIQWAWELLTNVWKIDKKRLYATYYYKDEETKNIWVETTDIDNNRILPFDEKDNFWEMAETGPCGPCTEIHIDLGANACDKRDDPNHKCQVNGDCGRFVEIWNLVFIQYNRDEKGILKPLNNKFVDTGMGFERLVAVLQNKNSNYETDIFMPIIREVENISGEKYNSITGIPHRVIADHIRALTFAITDGAIPSNDGRGYVLRRILRRALRQGHKIGLKEPFLYKLSEIVIEEMGDFFPELKEKREKVSSLLKSEEERFLKTLDRGIVLFEEIKEKVKKDKKNTISGKDVFMLYDTYGFPVDMTALMAEEEGLKIDNKGFEEEMKKQKERSRKNQKDITVMQTEWIVLNEGESVFTGYESFSEKTRILKYAIDEGNVYMILEKTPFYAESGGQIADVGYIEGQGFKLFVKDVKSSTMGNIHICELKEGEIVNTIVEAGININRRKSIMRNHTATHLLHSALRRVLGDKVFQEGSFVSDSILRFDFSHSQSLKEDELNKIEELVNQWIYEDYNVETIITDIKSAKEMGAMALFGEKYGDEVRVVKAGNISIELCGGTHVQSTGLIGSFFILSESSVAAGIRRVECVTGLQAYENAHKWKDNVYVLKNLLKTKEEKITEKVMSIIEVQKKLEKDINKLKSQIIETEAKTILEKTTYINDIKFIDYHIEYIENRKDIKLYVDAIKNKFNEKLIGIITAGTDNGGHIVIFSTKDMKEEFNAGRIIKEIGSSLGIRGGGRFDMAETGVKDKKILMEFKKLFTKYIKEYFNG